jgi:tetratricopeptide (TPR) repeat protein
MYAETGELDRAQGYFLAALDCDRAYAPSLTNLGNIYLERGELEQATLYYGLALESDPEYPEAHHNLAVAYRKQGQMHVFVRQMKQADRYHRERARQFRRGSVSAQAAPIPSRWLPWALVGLLALLALAGISR